MPAQFIQWPGAPAEDAVIYQKHCPGCFANKSGLAVCPRCGYDESAERSPLYLPHGLVIGGQYRVGRVLGQPGGFGISYLAWDVHLQQRVAIKEYLPRALAGRVPGSPDVSVHVPEHQRPFDDGLEHFLAEGRVIARFDHPNVVRVRNFFRAHGTAYLVMDYYEGISLGDYLAGLPDGRVEPQSAARLLGPVLEGLQFVHERGIVHRDVKPHNIYLASGGRAILLDFGSAAALRPGAGDQPALLLSEGYAPLEQYQRDAQPTPATDVYGVAATLYRMITGRLPPGALDRVGHDPLAQEVLPGGGAFQAVLRKALSQAASDRYPSAVAFRDSLFDALEIAEPRHRAVDDAATTEPSVPATLDEPWPSPPPAATVGGGVAVAGDELMRAARLVAGAVLAGAALIAAAVWLG